MRQKKCAFVACLLLTAVACRVQKTTSATANYSLTTEGPMWGAVYHQKAGEYKALCYQAYNTAAMQLNLLLQKQYQKPTAIVTDIDETVLDNSPYTVHQALLDKQYDDKTWMQWTSQASCDTVPGALSFLKYATSKGVDIFYITNRLEAERAATLKNLQHWGFPNADSSHLFLKTATSGKEPRRSIVSQTHEILLLCGDNLSDFSSVFDKKPYDERNRITEENAALFGSKFIVLPNAMYGDWEGALYHFNQLSIKEKDSIVIHSLRNY